MSNPTPTDSLAASPFSVISGMEIKMPLSFKEVFRDLQRLVGQMVVLQGHIVVTGTNDSFFTANYDSYKRGDYIPICDHKQISKQLLSTLPTYVGSDCLYDEEALLVGMISASEVGFRLTDLKSCTIHRDGVDLVILL
jgi:hypothetical protein